MRFDVKSFREMSQKGVSWEESWPVGTPFPVETVEAKYAFMKIGQILRRFVNLARKRDKACGTKSRVSLVVRPYVFTESGVILLAIVRVAKKHRKPSGMISLVKDVVERFMRIVTGIILLCFAKHVSKIIRLSISRARIAGAHLRFQQARSSTV
jgi:hypothetical protein